jgi:hypothetical protein
MEIESPLSLYSYASTLRNKGDLETVHVERAFGITEYIDNEKGKSDIEQCLYAALVKAEIHSESGTKKKAALSGIYYLERSLLVNPIKGNYASARQKLIEKSKATHGISDDEIKEVLHQARHEYLLNPKGNARLQDAVKKLTMVFSSDAWIGDIVSAWCDPSLENRQVVLDYAKKFVQLNRTLAEDEQNFKTYVWVVSSTCVDIALMSAFKKMLDNRMNLKSSADMQLAE